MLLAFCRICQSLASNNHSIAGSVPRILSAETSIWDHTLGTLSVFTSVRMIPLL
jgi:hypothetical protein